MPRERTIHAAGVHRLKQRGAYLVSQTSPPADAGTPDVLACYRGRFLAVEWKQPGQKPTPVQHARAREILRAGGIYVVARSVADVDRALDGIDRAVDATENALRAAAATTRTHTLKPPNRRTAP